jgi:Zn-dependent protease
MFGGRITLFQMFGFKVSIDMSWLLLAALIVWSLGAGYFPSIAPGMGSAVYWAMGVAGLFGLAASIVVHELAHALVARRDGLLITGITLFVFGGVAEMSGEPASPRAELAMAVAGPLMSLAVAVLAYGASGAAVAAGVPEGHPAVIVGGYLALVNLVLALFNMIPAFPLDGGRVLRALLWAWRRDVVWATRVAAGAGGAGGLALMALGLWHAVTGAPVAGLWWFVLGLFLRAAAAQAVRQQVMRQGLSGRTVGRLMQRLPVTVAPDLPLARLVEDYVVLHGHTIFPVVAEGRLIGCVGLDAVGRVAAEERSRRTVADVMENCAGRAIADTADAAEALGRMQRQHLSRLLVTRDSVLVGVLSLKDLLHTLTVGGDGVLSAANDRGPVRKAG